MNTEGDTLRLELKKRKISQEDFATSLGFSRGYLVQLLQRAVLPETVKKDIADKWKTTVQELFGNVQMNTQVVREPEVQYITNVILHVPVEAEAGFIGGDYNPVTNNDLFVYKLPGYDRPGFSFRVKGDSMFPTFKDGEIVITNQQPEAYDTIRHQYIYVIVTAENILIKRIEKSSEQGILLLCSDGDKVTYPPLKVNFDDVKIYRARRNITWDLSKKY